jgi:hypothetical protein
MWEDYDEFVDELLRKRFHGGRARVVLSGGPHRSRPVARVMLVIHETSRHPVGGGTTTTATRSQTPHAVPSVPCSFSGCCAAHVYVRLAGYWVGDHLTCQPPRSWRREGVFRLGTTDLQLSDLSFCPDRGGRSNPNGMTGAAATRLLIVLKVKSIIKLIRSSILTVCPSSPLREILGRSLPRRLPAAPHSTTPVTRPGMALVFEEMTRARR